MMLEMQTANDLQLQTVNDYQVGKIKINAFKSMDAYVLDGVILDVQEARDSIVSGFMKGVSFLGSATLRGGLSTKIQVQKTIIVQLESGREIQVTFKTDNVSFRPGQRITICEVKNSFVFFYNHNLQALFNLCPYFAPWNSILLKPLSIGTMSLSSLLIPIPAIGFFVGLFFTLIGLYGCITIDFAANIGTVLKGLGIFFGTVAIAAAPVLIGASFLIMPAFKNRKIIDNFALKILGLKKFDYYSYVMPF